jgi:mono/diheme cytochrome c family protein
MRRLSKRGTVATLALLLAGCSDHGTDPPLDSGDGHASVSYAKDVQPIWDTNCVVCHGISGGLDLSGPGSRANLVGIASTNWGGVRVAAGDPDQSILYRKLTGDAGTGDRMPQGGALDPADIEVVRRWIVEGAQDN